MQKLYEEESIQAIANAIRLKNGTTETYKPSEMAGAISALGGDNTSFKDLLELGVDGLTEITVPEGVTKLCNNCFMYYSALETVHLPSTLVLLGSSAFSGCESLKNIVLPDGLTTIYPRAFEDCASIESITIPAGVQNLYEYTFGWCMGMTEVTFKGTPASISADAFGKSTSIETINVPWAEGAVANAPWGATNATINYNYVG